MMNKLKETNWNELLASEDVNDTYDTFTARSKNILWPNKETCMKYLVGTSVKRLWNNKILLHKIPNVIKWSYGLHYQE